VRALVGELGEEVLVDAAEDVAVGGLELFRVELAQQLTEGVIADGLVFRLGQHATQGGVVGFDALHRGEERGSTVRRIWQAHQMVELGFGAQEDGALLAEVLLRQGFWNPAALRQAGLDLRLDGQIATVGVAQEDQAHHGHEVLVAGQIGIGAQQVGGAPQALFDRFDGLELAHGVGVLGCIGP